MKTEKLRGMRADTALRILFCGITALFPIVAFLAPDRAEMLGGFSRIITGRAMLTRDYFCMEIGSVSGAFLNAFLVGAIAAAMSFLPGVPAGAPMFAACTMTLGFAFFGVNAVNMLAFLPGIALYSAVRHEPFGKNAPVALFSTALAPLISEALYAYPGTQLHLPGFWNIVLALALGTVIGFCMPTLCAHSQNFHLGYNLYNAGPAAGFLAFAIYALMYRTLGVTAPEITATLGGGDWTICNVTAGGVFLLCLLCGAAMNGWSFKGYGKLLLESGRRCDFTQKYGAGLCLVNFGVYGLVVLAYYNLIGATFTGPTFCCVWGMVAFAGFGATPLNTLPIMIGYFLASRFGATALNAQAIIVGLCFATGLAPFSGRFGPLAGIAAGMAHYCLVTSVVFIHGGMSLYNGGFTGGIAAFLLAPLMERFLKPVRYATDLTEK